MALYICLKDSKSSYEWHMGNSSPISHEQVRDVVEIQADGDELELIEDEMGDTVLMHGGRVVRWFGDDARFIMGRIHQLCIKK